jgi:hypothetical protein
MAAGIMDTVQRMGTVIIVVPLVLAGADMLVFGDRTAMGALLLTIAAVVWVVSEYVRTPKDVGESLLQRAVGRVTKTPDDED